ncbi:centromere protein U-like isoform X1 [Carassius carassius]|uniref:centromere protein U-like isoform X1 n=1 Tax=Carassius carassius TaxID=217509 RepID=UPI002869130C|nr:centromere protein U-like isoform X1 [Carassius carassius]XP_059372219.1 centromere protein U-like isoform X1 [Carassius carassius]XP_059372220.1 centromere protein U-like isoform X1 [Carassius carassius]
MQARKELQSPQATQPSIQAWRSLREKGPVNGKVARNKKGNLHLHQINSTINQKRTRLVEANNELIKGKTKLRNLQKDHDEMEQRLKALRDGSSLLTNLQELNTKYMKHRTAHPDEVETYGPTCMLAMLMEARCIMGTEHQLKTVNDHLQQVFDETENE